MCALYPELPNPNWTRELVAREVQFALEDNDIEVDDDFDDRRQLQKDRDFTRLSNNQSRQEARRINAVEVLLTDIAEQLRDLDPSFQAPPRSLESTNQTDGVMVVHLSDLHLQSIIDTPANRFDFVVASQRSPLILQRIKDYGQLYGVHKVVVAMGGDFLKNDKRTDEYLTNACNRSKAVVLSTHLLQQMLLDLHQSFDVEVVSVAGDESRAKESIGWAEEAVTDNYDSLIYWMLEMVLQEVEGIHFHPHQGNEQVFSIHGQTVLLLHGHQRNFSQQKSIQSVIGQ